MPTALERLGDDCRIKVALEGAETAPVVVLSWYDHRGHGGSDTPAGAADLRGAIRAAA